MAYNVTLIPGDGIGPEVTKAAVRVLEATGIKFVWDSVEAGEQAQQKYGTPVPDSLLTSIRKNKLALKGPVTTPVGTGFRSVNVAIRQTLDLYSCLRPIKSFKGAPSRYENVDIIIVRENTEDLYSSIEFEKGSSGAGKISAIVAQELNKKIGDDAGISLKVISEKATRRIVRFAFDYARQYKRKKVTAVHKANILKYSDGLFLAVSKEVAKEYPDIGYENVIIDNLCMQLVRSPEQYDVLVLPNLYGDIISDLCAGLIGGLGLAPTANIGDGIAVFEATHGSAPKYKGLNKVNPMAVMLAGVLMLRYINEKNAADRLEKAITDIIAENKYVTYDLKTNRNDPTAVGTSQVADAIIQRIRQ